jgi:hypothetical protein
LLVAGAPQVTMQGASLVAVGVSVVYFYSMWSVSVVFVH